MVIIFDHIDQLPILPLHHDALIDVFLECPLILDHNPAGAAEIEQALVMLLKLVLIWH